MQGEGVVMSFLTAHRCQVYGPCLDCGRVHRIEYLYYDGWHEMVCTDCERGSVGTSKEGR